MNHFSRLLFGVVLCLSVRVAFGDEIFLINGGVLHGEIRNLKDSDDLLVNTTQGTILLLTASQVSSVVKPDEATLAYEKLLPQMPLTADGHWKMAEWCRGNSLLDLYRGHLSQVLQFDPEHEGARRGLGYSFVDDEWVLPEKYNRERGYIRDGGAWKHPQEVALEKRAERIEKAQKAWIVKLKMWRSWLNGRKQAQAKFAIENIKDPLAGKALAEAIKDPKEIPDIKLLYVGVLENLRSSAGIAALVETAINDENVEVREACVAALVRRNETSAIPHFIRALKLDDNRKVNNAGFALAEFADERAVPALIDALLTEHKTKIGGGGGPGSITTGFGNGGSGGIGVGGGGPKVLQRTLANPGVLRALSEITKANFQYNQESWRNWYAEEQTPDVVNLRRGEL